MAKPKKVELEKLVEDAVKLEKYKEYKRNLPEKYSLSYDKYLIEDFLKNNKRQVKAMEKALIAKEYWLKYNTKLLHKKLRREIVPPLMKNEITPTGTQATLDNDYDLQVYTFLKRDDIPLELQEDKYKELDRALASMIEEDRLLIKMKFGIMPFDREHKYVDIAKFFVDYYKGTISTSSLFCRDPKVLSAIFQEGDAENLKTKPGFLETPEFNSLHMHDQRFIMQQHNKKSKVFSENRNYSNNAFLSKRIKELLVELRQPLSIMFGDSGDGSSLYELDEETFNNFNGNIFLD